MVFTYENKQNPLPPTKLIRAYSERTCIIDGLVTRDSSTPLGHKVLQASQDHGLFLLQPGTNSVLLMVANLVYSQGGNKNSEGLPSKIYPVMAFEDNYFVFYRFFCLHIVED